MPAGVNMNERPVTMEDLNELKQDIKALEGKVDELSSALQRIELKLAESRAESTLKAAADVARLELELAKYRGRTSTDIGNISTKTAVLWGIFGAGGLVTFGAVITTVVQKLFGVKP